MPIRVDLLALEPSVPGQACLTVKKWQGAHERLEFSIQRNQDGYYLQDHKAWSNNPFWFKVPHFSEGASGEALETLIGPEVVDPLLEGSGNLATPTVPVSSLEIPDVPELVLPEPVTAQPEPEPVPEPVKVEPAVLPAPVPARKKSLLIPLIVGLLVLIALAVAAWFFLSKKPDAPIATPAPAPKVEPAASVAAGACTLESMTSEPELAFVQTCIKQAPASAELLKIIETAKASNHCGVAQRLYANRSQAGDVLIATAYAHEYDPKYHQANACFTEPDKATAAYWYETILSHEPDNAEARQRFEELKP